MWHTGHGNMGHGTQKRTHRDMGKDNISSKWMAGETKRKTAQGTGNWKGGKYEGNSK